MSNNSPLEESRNNSPATTWPDLAGRLIQDQDKATHVLPIRVYFEDTDFSGLVYHASYVRWCERGRSDFLRLLGNDHRQLFAGADNREPAAFVVRRMTLDYLRPARIDDIVQVTTRVKALGAATLTLDQRITRLETDGRTIDLLQAEVMVVLVSAGGRVLRLTKMIRDALASSRKSA